MNLLDRLPINEKTKGTLMLRAFGLLKTPLIFAISPTVEELKSDRCRIKIPLNRRTRNHLGSLYFGSISIGADCVIGLLAMNKIKRSGKDISLVFKDFKADFHKRPDGDTYFLCDQGAEIDELIKETVASGERVNKTIRGTASVKAETVCSFELTLSLKLKKKGRS